MPRIVKSGGAGASNSGVALLRGVNVGGKNLLPMPALGAMFTSAGCTAAKTYIQSGNVVFKAPARLFERLPRLISAAITEDFGLTVPVVVRTLAELESAAKDNPFLAPGKDTDALHLLFLEAAPTASAVATLDPKRSPPDEFAVLGRHVYLRCPNGIGHSKLTNAYFDSKLATVSTGRNWRTVQKLIELARA